ncbi:S-formylglutathione hydrolase FrmB [Flaviramulus basaltis]|uniref:S-formylglutathione hydrolase FrmB n=1 Tax=Flaviramulus basaltis TaxID=369401 RepID=A0A1K2IET7_9FLAO|nr:alpha/beta hydrolase-fold protein [Flaviramulus basaltis]SFZ90941.1 S-formylglutathione hydrolase FrmB [Flaviramulus basaltis]
MQNIFRLFILSFLVFNVSFSQTGKVFDQLSHASKILKTDRNFAVYLPPDYDTSQRSYPVLYLLHGAGDDQTGWVQFGEVLSITDKAIMEGTATPMIIVMPDAFTSRLGYFNDIQGDWNYEDYFFKELMPYVENKYRIKKEKRFRAVAGLSMGGGGSFMYALHHPELFASACPLSAYIGPSSVEAFKERLKSNNVEVNDVDAETYFPKHNALSLIDNMTKEQIESVRWYIDCGDDDFLYEGNSLVHVALRNKDVKHEFRIRDGGHTWTYWRESLPEVLKFVSDGFHQY